MTAMIWPTLVRFMTTLPGCLDHNSPGAEIGQSALQDGDRAVRSGPYRPRERWTAATGVDLAAHVVQQRPVHPHERVGDHPGNHVIGTGPGLRGDDLRQRPRVPVEDLPFAGEERRAVRDGPGDPGELPDGLGVRGAEQP